MTNPGFWDCGGRRPAAFSAHDYGQQDGSREEAVITDDRSPLHGAAGTGAMRPGPGDLYRFLTTAGVGDFVNVPRGTAHRFQNQGTEAMRMIVTCTPAGGIEFSTE